ncbi:MAG: hypothetical protein WDZ79_00585 [Candidatus Paceibacterota bacterium]
MEQDNLQSEDSSIQPSVVPADGMTSRTEQQTDRPTESKPADEHSEVLMGVLAYIGILFIVPLLVAKDSAFAQYHAKQGAVLFIAEVATMFFSAIPILGWFIGPIVMLVWFVFAVIGIINVVQKQQKPLPLIGGLAKHF